MLRASPSPRRSRPSRQPGFTLVELLTVMVIIIILLSITISIAKLVGNKQNITKATAELQSIETALDAFKNQYGDYPPADPNSATASENNLVLALTGRARWSHKSNPQTGVSSVVFSANATMPTDSTSSQTVPYKPFLDASKFTIGTDSTHPANPVFLDPWGNAYLYRYKTINDVSQPDPKSRVWQTVGYLLVSRGPDQAPGTVGQIFPVGMDKTGTVPANYFDTSANPGNADNLTNWQQ